MDGIYVEVRQLVGRCIKYRTLQILLLFRDCLDPTQWASTNVTYYLLLNVFIIYISLSGAFTLPAGKGALICYLFVMMDHCCQFQRVLIGLSTPNLTSSSRIWLVCPFGLGGRASGRVSPFWGGGRKGVCGHFGLIQAQLRSSLPSPLSIHSHNGNFYLY